MEQYLDLLKAIKDNGTHKSAARENMPGTLSLFGYQMRFNLADGFPLLTTKKLRFKNIVIEFLWFLRGDTNIKYLVDNGCNIWNEDAYNYYLKRFAKADTGNNYPVKMEEFINRTVNADRSLVIPYYKFGDCGEQYGRLWRRWEKKRENAKSEQGFDTDHYYMDYVDQIKDLISGLKSNPMSRRHIITAWNPATLDDMALNACHSFVQFNCRPLSYDQRLAEYNKIPRNQKTSLSQYDTKEEDLERFNSLGISQYYLDCQMYQRSADVFLGVPYNIASYALLTEILAKVCNMIPGEFIHTFGDVHIYDNHIQQVNEQLQRIPDKLPTLSLSDDISWSNMDIDMTGIRGLDAGHFTLNNYNPQPAIKAPLSTGLIK